MKNFSYNCVLLIVLCLLFLVNRSIGNPTNRNVTDKQCSEAGGECKDGGTSSSGYMPSTQDPDLVDSTDYEPEIHIVTSTVLPSFGERYNSSQCLPMDTNCTDSSQCCSNRCVNFYTRTECGGVILPSTGAIYNSSQCFGILQKCTDSSQCCSNECIESGLGEYFSDFMYVCSLKRDPKLGGCLINGTRCRANWECCTRSCEGSSTKRCVAKQS